MTLKKTNAKYSWDDFEDDVKEHVIEPITSNPLGAVIGGVAGASAFGAAGGSLGATIGGTAGAVAGGTYLRKPGSGSSAPYDPYAGSYPSAFEEDYGISIEDQKELAKWQFDENMKNFPIISDAALDNAVSVSGDLDKFMSERFYKNLENVLPNWREDIIGRSINQLDTISAITDDQLKGEVPKDVSDYIIRTRAELGISRGLFGETATYATARDLGKTSMDIQQQGIQNVTNSVSPLTQRLLSYAQQLQPPVSDPSAIYGAGMGALTGVNLTSVGAVMQMGLQADQFSSEMAWSQAQSQINYGIMQQQMAQQQRQFEEAQAAAEMNMWVGAGASLLGGGLGLLSGLGGLGGKSIAGTDAWGSTSSFTMPSTSLANPSYNPFANNSISSSLTPKAYNPYE